MKKYVVTVDNYGTVSYYKYGSKCTVLHREDGPAVECSNGNKYWYLNGQYHREDGPAIEHSNGDKEWYLNGQKYTEAQYKAKVNSSCEGKVVEIDGVKYKLVEDK